MQADGTQARPHLKGFHLALKSEQRLQPMVWYGCNLCNLWRLWVLILWWTQVQKTNTLVVTSHSGEGLAYEY